jgi:MFS transporter, SP family, arabinose:H+ symporter
LTSELQDEHSSWRTVLDPQYRRIVVLAVGVLLLQQLGGINAVTYYSATIFSEAGIEAPAMAALVNGAVNFAFTVVATLLMDSCGRKLLWITSHAGCAACLGVLAAMIAIKGMHLTVARIICSSQRPYISVYMLQYYVTP